MRSKGRRKKRPLRHRSVSNQVNQGKAFALKQMPAASQVFSTELLLVNILENLSINQLLHLRSLNQAWNEGACKLLCKLQSFNIEISCPELTQSEPYDYDALRLEPTTPSSTSESEKTKLELLTETIIRSTELDLKFPCCQYDIDNLQLERAITQNFFLNSGHLIKIFRAYFCYDIVCDSSLHLQLLGNLLFNQLPNLCHLLINTESNYLVNKKQEYFDQILLAGDSVQVGRRLLKLKELEIGYVMHISILKCILQAAINLEGIQLNVDVHNVFNPEDVIEALVIHEKTHLLSSLSLFFITQLLDPIEKLLLKTPSQIKVLNLISCEDGMSEESKVRVDKIFIRIITSNGPSLETLLTYPLVFHRSFDIPTMPKLRNLEFIHSGGCQTLFPANFKMSRLFPRLKTLRIRIDACERMRKLLFQKSLLGGSYADEVSTIKSMDFENKFGKELPRDLFNMFPYLVSVNLSLFSYIRLNLNDVWGLAHLKKLVLAVSRRSRHDAEVNESLALDLEGALTGFSPLSCQQLFQDRLGLIRVKSLTRSNSLVSAKCLTELHLQINDCFQEDRTSGQRPMLSHVTYLHAFKVCPQVHVYIRVAAWNKKNIAALMTDVLPVMPYVMSITETAFRHHRGHGKWCSCDS